MGDGLHLALVELEGGLQECLTVTGGAAVGDACVGRQQVPDFLHGLDGRRDRRSLVVCIELVEKLTLLGNEGQLRRGGAGIDAEEDIAVICTEVGCLYARLRMTLREFLILSLAMEERVHTLDLGIHLDAVTELLDERRDGYSFRVLRAVQTGADRREEMAVLRLDDLITLQMEGTDEGLAELRHEVKRAAKEGDVTTDRLALCEAGDGLVDDRLEDRRREILARRTLVDQRLDIRLCEDTTACGDRVDHLITGGEIVETGRVGMKEGGHLVNEGARTAGTDAVHALVDPTLEIYDFCVLAAELDGDVRIRTVVLERGCDRDDFLTEENMHVLAQRQSTRTGDDRREADFTQRLLRFLENICQRALDIRVMTAVVREQKLFRLIEDGDLYGCRTNVDSESILLHDITSYYLYTFLAPDS